MNVRVSVRVRVGVKVGVSVSVSVRFRGTCLFPHLTPTANVAIMLTLAIALTLSAHRPDLLPCMNSTVGATTWYHCDVLSVR